jgi:signal peptidase I
MKDLKSIELQFSSLYERYKKRRAFFENKITRWGQRGYKKYNEKGKELLSKADSTSSEIREILSRGLRSVSAQEINAKVKAFRLLYKELHNMTKSELRQWVEALIVAGSVVFFLRNYVFGLYHVPTGSAEPNLLVGDRVWGNKLVYRIGAKPQYGELAMFEDPTFKYDEDSAINYYWQKYIGFPIPLLGLKTGPENLVKRVIAVPGDVIEGRIEGNRPVIYKNGTKLDEPYVNPYPLIGLDKKIGFLNFDYVGPLHVPNFLRQRSQYVFYTYVPSKDFSDQPFYNMSSEEVVLQPGSLHAWLRFPNEYSKVDQFGPITVPEGKYWMMGDSRKNSKDSRYWGFLDESLVLGRPSFIIYSVDSEEPLWLFELIKHPISFWTKSVRWSRSFMGLSFESLMKRLNASPMQVQETKQA